MKKKIGKTNGNERDIYNFGQIKETVKLRHVGPQGKL
jgi:hypothetical protein